MRLIADAVAHDLGSVGHYHKGGRILAADDPFEGRYLLEAYHRVEDLLLPLRKAPLTVEDGHTAVNFVENPGRDPFPPGRDDEDRLPLAKTLNDQVYDL
jgi:hypothetical protein